MFAFDLYNKNFTGELEPEDVAKLLRDLYGDGETKNSVHAITAMKDLKALERDEKTFKVGQFVAFMQTRQALLYPAYQVQTALRRRLLGESFWEAQIERRMEMSNGQYLPVQKLIITVRACVHSVLASCLMSTWNVFLNSAAHAHFSARGQ
jgi:hypothetical protein